MAYETMETVRRGDDRVFTFTVRHPDAPETPVNVTGWSFWMTGKAQIEDPDSAAAFRCRMSDSPATITVTAATGVVNVALIPAHTATQDHNTELFVDFQGKDAAGKIRTLDDFKLKIIGDITQATT